MSALTVQKPACAARNVVDFRHARVLMANPSGAGARHESCFSKAHWLIVHVRGIHGRSVLDILVTVELHYS